MLMDKLKRKYSDIQYILNEKLEDLELNAIGDLVAYGEENKTIIKMENFVDKICYAKYYTTIGQKFEKQLQKHGFCVVPELQDNDYKYDVMRIYNNSLSHYLCSIDEHASYKCLINNPLIADDFTEIQQQAIIEILKAVINAAEYAEDYVTLKTWIDANIMTAVVETFNIKKATISTGYYKLWGWADEN